MTKIHSKMGRASARQTKWLGAIVAAMLCGAAAHAQSIILQDNFPGTAGSAPNPANWTASSGITLTGSGSAQFNNSGGVQILDSLSSYNFVPTSALYGSLSTTYSSALGFEIIGFKPAGENFALRTDQGGGVWSMLLGSNFFETSVNQTVSESGTWVIDWYTNKVQAYYNGTLEFDSTVNAPTNGGTVSSWVIPNTSTYIEDAVYSGGANGLTLSNVTWQSVSTVPEPSVTILGGLGMLIALMGWRRKERRQG